MAALGRYHITGNAKDTTLSGGALGPTGLSFNITDGSGWPTGGANGKFPVVLNRGMSNEEHILASSRTGTTISIASLADRGLDGTTATTHDPDSRVYHGYLGMMANEANEHVNDATQDHHTQYMRADGTRHDLTARHSVGSVIPVGAPVALAIGGAQNSGVATTAARSDHAHAMPAFGNPVSIGTANAAGAAVTVPRSDHVHDLANGVIDSHLFFGSGMLPLFSQDNSPGAIANAIWFDTNDRILKVRNGSNTVWEHWLQTGWRTYTPTITGFNIGTGTAYGYYLRMGSLCLVEFGFNIGASASSSGVPLQLTLPVNAVDPGLANFNWIGAGRLFKPGVGGGRFASIGIINAASAAGNIQSFATAGQDPWDNDSPVAPWTENTIFNGFAAYQCAIETS